MRVKDQNISPKLKTEPSASKHYNNGRENLSDELLKLDFLVHVAVLKRRRLHPEKKHNEFAGLYITDDEIDKIVDKELKGKDKENTSTEKLRIETDVRHLNKLQAEISEKVKASLKLGIHLPLQVLSYLFSLSPFELDSILTCLAPELDLKYEKLYSYLQDDVTKKHPSVNLILDLLCSTQDQRIDARTYFLPQAPLLKYSLISFDDDTQQKHLLSRCLKLDDRIVNFLLDFNFLDQRLESFVKIKNPERDWSSVIAGEELKERLKRLAKEYFNNGIDNKIILYLRGPYGSGRKSIAEAFCKELNLPLIISDVRQLINSEVSFDDAVRLLFREALLQPAAIYLEHLDTLFKEDLKEIHYLNILVKAIEEFSFVTFLAGEKTWNPQEILKKDAFIRLDIPLPSYSIRKRVWESSLDTEQPLSLDVDTEALANKFRFTGGQIKDAIADARNIALMRDSGDNFKITSNDFYRSCRAQSNQKLSEMARKIIPHYSWFDIVLPADKFQQLKEICNYVKYRQKVYEDWGFDKKISLGKGLNILFSGPSGTGKTMAAEIIAKELNLDLYKIDLSCVVSKYIGETEKNLNKIFKEAETSNAVLFFDEADALFGKRSEVKDSHDRYANIEINYLLQKMEEHEGIAILASNFRKNMDEAFTRRMHFTVDFPFPDEEYRLRIWKNIFPKETPVSEVVDFEFLAKKFKISGGNIKNIALNAAFLAAEKSREVDIKQIIQAIKREYQKMGKLCVQSDFGKYYGLVMPEKE